MLRGSVDKALRDTIFGHSLRGMEAYYLKPSDEDLTGGNKEYTDWLEVLIANLDKTLDQGKRSRCTETQITS